MSRYIYDLIKQQENQKLDFKHSIDDSKKIARSLVAFSNTDGGRLLIGVRDNGSIAGVNGDEEFYMVQAAAELYCKPAIKFETKAWTIEGKTILEISIPKLSGDKLVTAPDKNGLYKVYIRVNDENIIVNNIYLKAWNLKRFGNGILIRYDEPEKTLFKYLQDNKNITFSRFKKLTNLSKYKAEKIIVNLIVLDILKIDFSENQIKYQLSKQ
ncbi:MAG TPA: ATP-binding protein [Bacteroidales bacterium]|jgi:predicted HTH transcriptional regulator|nr:ATP-binding protein [Bacteroidales bacterium]